MVGAYTHDFCRRLKSEDRLRAAPLRDQSSHLLRDRYSLAMATGRTAHPITSADSSSSAPSAASAAPFPPSHVPLFRCHHCTLPLSLTDELVSRAFQGATGPAILVRSAWNVREGERETKNLMSGRHVIAREFRFLVRASPSSELFDQRAGGGHLKRRGNRRRDLPGRKAGILRRLTRNVSPPSPQRYAVPVATSSSAGATYAPSYQVFGLPTP